MVNVKFFRSADTTEGLASQFGKTRFTWSQMERSVRRMERKVKIWWSAASSTFWVFLKSKLLTMVKFSLSPVFVSFLESDTERSNLGFFGGAGSCGSSRGGGGLLITGAFSTGTVIAFLLFFLRSSIFRSRSVKEVELSVGLLSPSSPQYLQVESKKCSWKKLSGTKIYNLLTWQLCSKIYSYRFSCSLLMIWYASQLIAGEFYA